MLLGIFIIGAPVFFSTVWGWIKRWFDPITVSKIFILSESEIKPTLESFIEPRNIPRKYGGELDFDWGMNPISDPTWEGNLEWDNGYTGFTSGPMVWRPSEDGKRLECIALGSENGKKRNLRVCSVRRTWPSADNGTAPEKADQAAEEKAAEEKTAELTDGVQGLSASEKAAADSQVVDEKEKTAAKKTTAAPPATVN